MKIAAVALSIAAIALTGCSRKETTETTAAKGTEGAISSSASLADAEAAVPSDPERHAYFGNLHVHTSLSFDAFTNGSRTTPEDAYGWAQGAAMTSSGHGDPIQLKTPLDFYMVSDHAEMLGVFEIGVRYQMYHALALLACAWAATRWPGGAVTSAGWLFVAGTVVFSGSLYALALSGQRWLGAVTPLGGLAFLGGWLALAWGVWSGR